MQTRIFGRTVCAGRSERLVGRLLAERDGLTVATKIGRRADPHVPAAFTRDAMRDWTERRAVQPDQVQQGVAQLEVRAHVHDRW